MPISLEPLNLVMELAGEKAVETGADRVSTKLDNMRMKVSRLSEGMGKLSGRVNFFMGTLAATGIDLRNVGQQLGIISDKERYQAKSVLGQIVGGVVPVSSAFAGFRVGAIVGAKIGATLGPLGGVIGSFLGSILGSIGAAWIGDLLSEQLEKLADWYTDLIKKGLGIGAGAASVANKENIEEAQQKRGARILEHMRRSGRLTPEQAAFLAAERRSGGEDGKINPLITTRGDAQRELRKRLYSYTAANRTDARREDEGMGFKILRSLGIDTGKKSFDELQKRQSEKLQTEFERFKNDVRLEIDEQLRAALGPELEQRKQMFLLLNDYFGS